MFNMRHRQSSICGTVDDAFLVLTVSLLSPPQNGGIWLSFLEDLCSTKAPVSGILFFFCLSDNDVP